MRKSPVKPVTSLWTRAAPTRRTTLTRDDIVQAAIAVADKEGLDVVSLRRVADELETRATSLYTYMDSKDELLALMLDRVVGEFLVREQLPSDWRETIVVLAKRQRASALRHPWISELAGRSDLTASPNALRFLDQMLGALDGLGADVARRWEAVRAIVSFIAGYSIREKGVAGPHSSSAPAASLRPAAPFSAFERSLVGPMKGELTHLVELLDANPVETTDNFEQGLRWLLAGIAADTRSAKRNRA